MLYDCFYELVGRRIVPTFEVRKLYRNQVRMTRRKLCRPQLEIGACGESIFFIRRRYPADERCNLRAPRRRTADRAGLHPEDACFAKTPGIPASEIFLDLMIKAGGVMVAPSKDDNADTAFAFEQVQTCERLFLNLRVHVSQQVILGLCAEAERAVSRVLTA